MVANYRSISVINTVIKIITKILASMLQEHLPKRELFILIVDTLNRFLHNHQSIMPTNSYLSPKTIHFADDTVIISEANLVTLRIITRVLKIYGELTCLKINKIKSLFVPVAIPPQLTQIIRTNHPLLTGNKDVDKVPRPVAFDQETTYSIFPTDDSDCKTKDGRMEIEFPFIRGENYTGQSGYVGNSDPLHAGHQISQRGN